jgi:hypothetical protein
MGTGSTPRKPERMVECIFARAIESKAVSFP